MNSKLYDDMRVAGYDRESIVPFIIVYQKRKKFSKIFPLKYGLGLLLTGSLLVGIANYARDLKSDPQYRAL